MDAMFEPSENVTEKLFDFLVENHELGHSGFHGRDHWQRVLVNGRGLAEVTEANLKVVELFAVLHDSRRQNEHYDPEHGWRAAHYAFELRGTWFDATDNEMALLADACRYHSDGLTESDPTIQTCWDADRLDLGRVGIRPNPRFLCTQYAKRPDVIEAAFQRSVLQS